MLLFVTTADPFIANRAYFWSGKQQGEIGYEPFRVSLVYIRNLVKYVCEIYVISCFSGVTVSFRRCAISTIKLAAFS